MTSAAYPSPMRALPRRRLADWHPDAPDDEPTWLAKWAAAGWRPEYETHADLYLHGRWVHRWALIHTTNPDTT